MELIVCVDADGGIGKDGSMPWYFPEDLRYFREITRNAELICGRKTAESLPPLGDDRRVMVHSREPLKHKYKKGQIPLCSEGLHRITSKRSRIIVIGGSQIYEMYKPLIDRVWLTSIEHSYNCDTFFDVEWVTTNFNLILSESFGSKTQVKKELYVR